jgi:hypothetical protein
MVNMGDDTKIPDVGSHFFQDENCRGMSSKNKASARKEFGSFP